MLRQRERERESERVIVMNFEVNKPKEIQLNPISLDVRKLKRLICWSVVWSDGSFVVWWFSKAIKTPTTTLSSITAGKMCVRE